MNQAARESRKSGLYALVDLAGAPLNREAAVTLGLTIPLDPGAALAEAVDPHCPDAVQRAAEPQRLTILAGLIDRSAELAVRLGLAPDTPPIPLVRAALGRFGSELPAAMLGEWALFDWQRDTGVTVALSPAHRDPVLYALNGARLAIAPDIYRLGRIDWIKSETDPAGLLFAVARSDLREHGESLTMNPRVRQLRPGTVLTVSPSGTVRIAAADCLPTAEPFRGTFSEALEQTEAILRDSLRSRLGRAAKPALLLSGGLDSSLLAWLCAEEHPAGQMLALTSVAPPGSGLPDERKFAEIVAQTLGLELVEVAPAAELETFRPAPAILSSHNAPPMGNRHCITAGFQSAADAAGASLLVNGTYGDLTATLRLGGHPALAGLRRMAGTVRRRLRPLSEAPPPFHVRLAPHLAENLPEQIRAAMVAPAVPQSNSYDQALWGYHPGARKALGHANEFHAGALRMEFPFRDLRLLRFFASLPRAMLREPQFDRRPARALLAGHLPDSIRLRTSGMPAVPDHLVRMQAQAPAARIRRAAWLDAGADEWLDLNWLDASLARIAERGIASHAEANEVQLTAMAAEYWVWLRGQR